MLNSLLTIGQMFRVRRLSRTIAGMLQPLFAPGPEDEGNDRTASFLAPARLGFFSAAVAELAQRLDPGLGSDALAIVQLDVWRRLIGPGEELAGERMLSLSVAGDGDFARGCRAGIDCARTVLSWADLSSRSEEIKFWYISIRDL